MGENNHSSHLETNDMGKSTDNPTTGVWRGKRAKAYNINFRWNGRHNYSAYTDANLSARLRQDVLRQLERYDAGEVIDAAKLGKRCWEILADLGVVEPPTSTDAGELSAKYCEVLTAKGDTSDYVARVRSRLRKLVAGCKIKRIGDLRADKVQIFVGAVTGTTATKNHYLRTAKSWSKWLCENEYTPVDQLARLHLANAEKDRKIRRRPMTDDEFDRLIEHTIVDGRVLSAEARRLIYRIARYAGLRAGEIASLSKHK